MRKLGLYYLFHIILNATFLILFSSHAKFQIFSLIPAFLIILMLFQTTLFKSNAQSGTIENTTYSVGNTIKLTPKEQESQYSYLRHSFLLCIPFELPLIFFLDSYWKLIGVLPYIFSYIIGGVVFKIKNGAEIKNRIDLEKKELEEQIKREEMGLK